MKIKHLVALAVAVVFIIWGIVAYLGTTIEYVTFDEARAATRTVQVSGGIIHELVDYDTRTGRLEFTIYDLKSGERRAPDRMRVIYEGEVPANFDQATSVLVIGRPGDDGFRADKLRVKCPSKYQRQVDESTG